MRHSPQLTGQLIGRIHNAGLDPTLWTDVLRDVAAFCGAADALIVEESADRPELAAFRTSFSAPGWLERYRRHFIQDDPIRLATIAHAREGDVVISSDVMTARDFGRTPFARQWLSERGLVDVASAVLEKSATSITVLSTLRSKEQGIADASVRSALRRLLPHAQRALRIGRLLECCAMEAATLTEMLDVLSAPVVLVDAEGSILRANARAALILEDEKMARKTPSRLKLWDREAGRALAIAIEGVASGDGTDGRAIPVTARDGGRYVATVIALTAGRRGDGASADRAIAAVCLKEAAFDMPPAASSLGALYGLTTREHAILVATVELGAAADVASVMGISEVTVRTHLKAVFRKTGAVRQGDLVKLVAATIMPLARRPRRSPPGEPQA